MKVELTLRDSFEMLRVAREYIELRREALSRSIPNQLEFMRMCNAKAEHFGTVAPLMNNDELLDLHNTFQQMTIGEQRYKMPVTVLRDWTHADVTAGMELCGLLLGLRRMADRG